MSRHKCYHFTDMKNPDLLNVYCNGEQRNVRGPQKTRTTKHLFLELIYMHTKVFLKLATEVIYEVRKVRVGPLNVGQQILLFFLHWPQRSNMRSGCQRSGDHKTWATKFYYFY